MNPPRPAAGSACCSQQPLWLRVLLAAGAYALVAWLGVRLIVNPEKIAIFWPPSGLLLGVLLLSPPRDWRWLLAGTFLADVFVSKWGGYSWSVSAAYSVINQTEALIGAWLLRRWLGPETRLGGVRQLLALVLVTAGSSGVSATAGAASTLWWDGGQSFWGVWYVWWLSVLLGVMGVTPLLLAWASLRRPFLSNVRRPAEALALLLGTALVTALIFSRDPVKAPVAQSLLYAPFPFLIWAALRFRVAGAAAVSFVLVGLAVACTAYGQGPIMLIEGTTAQRIIWLQAYLGVASFSSLALAAGVAEREQAREALRDSERKTRAILDQTFAFIGLCRPDGTLVEANETALRFAGVRLDQVAGRPFWETPWWSHSIVEQQRVREAITRAAAGELVRYETNHLAPDGTLHTIDFSLKPIRDEGGRVVWLIPEGRDITDRKRSEEIHEGLRELAQQFTAPFTMKELGVVVARLCRRLFAYDAFLIYAVDLRTGHRRAVHAEDTPEGHVAPVEMTADFDADASALIRSIFEGQQKIINRFTVEEGPQTTAWGFKARRSRSLLFVPVQWEGSCVGVITVQSYTPGKYAQADLDLLQTIADQCGAASMRVQAELALRRSEEQLRQALDAAEMGTWYWNIASNEVFWSGRVETIFGLPAGTFERSYEAYLKLVHPDDDAMVRAKIRSALNHRDEPYRVEHRVLWADGSTHWIEGKGQVHRDQSGRPTHLTGTVVDITARKQAELALRNNERRLFQFLEASPIGVFVINSLGDAYFMNQNARTILGQNVVAHATPEQLTEVYQAYLAGTDQLYPSERLPIVRALRGERASADDMEIRRPDRTVPIQVWAAPIFDDSGQVAFAIAAFADITERRRAQDELRASEEKFSKAFLCSPDAIAITLLDTGRILEVNEGFARLFGVPPAEAIGRTTLELGIWPDEQQRTAAIGQLIREGSVRNLEVVLQHRCGERRTCLSSAELIELGGRRCMVSITRDISERKKTEEEVQQINMELEQRVRARTADLEAAIRELESFSYSVSHDLRAPLRHVSGFASLLLESAVLSGDPESRRHVQSIVTSAKKMGELIDDLLLFSRMGRAELHAGRIDLPELVGQLRQELHYETAEREIEWRIGPLPAVQGDAAMLRLVFQNLLGNAVKYTRRTPRTVIEIGASKGAGEHILFVRDNGAGFDMQYAAKLFGVFQRLHREDEFEGTGIGLANVRRIIQRHGGRTWAEGSPGQGATFYFSLPA